jgi:hypothetical protein
MKTKLCSLKGILLGAVATAALSLAACGGGGGSSISTGVTYTGVTTPATIGDNTSATALAGSVVSTASLDTSAIPILVGVGGTPTSLSTVDNLKHIVDLAKGVVAAAPAQSLSGALVTGSDTVYGCYGSSATFSGTVDDTYKDIDGIPIIDNLSITFRNYVADISVAQDGSACDSTRINGSMSFTVTYDGPVQNTPQMDSMTFTFTNLAVTDLVSNLSQTLHGSFAMSMNTVTGESSFTMTVNLQDTDGLVYRAENYTVTFDSLGRVTGISGRLYHPEHGYVDIATTTPLSYGLFCNVGGVDVPDTGVVTLSGDGSATMDANTGNCATYLVSWTNGTSTGSATVNW